MDSAIASPKDLLSRQIDHLRRLGDDAGQLQNLLNDVNAIEIDIDDRLESEGKEALAVVRNCMKGYHLYKRCLSGCCPHCVFMLSLSSTVRDRIPILQKLSEGGRFESLGGQLGDVSVGRQLVPVGELVGQASQRAEAVMEEGHGRRRQNLLVENLTDDPQLKPRFDVVICVTPSQIADI